jgi:rhodanese-related sulfurtransferase
MLLAWLGLGPWAGMAHAGEGDAASLRRWIASRHPDVAWVETERLAAWLSDAAGAGPVLLDARTPAEFAVSHLRGARRIDPEAAGLDPIELAHDTPLVVYCSVGLRSASVAERLARTGFTHVYNLEGGIFQWANEGREVYRGAERVAKVHPFDRGWGRLLRKELRSE